MPFLNFLTLGAIGTARLIHKKLREIVELSPRHTVISQRAPVWVMRRLGAQVSHSHRALTARAGSRIRRITRPFGAHGR